MKSDKEKWHYWNSKLVNYGMWMVSCFDLSQCRVRDVCRRSYHIEDQIVLGTELKGRSAIPASTLLRSTSNVCLRHSDFHNWLVKLLFTRNPSLQWNTSVSYDRLTHVWMGLRCESNQKTETCEFNTSLQTQGRTPARISQIDTIHPAGTETSSLCHCP